MTTQPASQTERTPIWRRPAPWLVLSGAVVVIVVVAVVIGFAMSANTNRSASQTPHAILVQMLNRTQDTVVAAGGTWTYQDKTAWDPKDTSGYGGSPCLGSTDGAQQYNVTLYSAGVADPAAAAAAVTKHWKGLGYAVRTVVPPQADNFDYTQIATDLPDGASIGYTVSKQVTGILSGSACSTDPGLSGRTK